jgi:hypothetical protein
MSSACMWDSVEYLVLFIVWFYAIYLLIFLVEIRKLDKLLHICMKQKKKQNTHTFWT